MKQLLLLVILLTGCGDPDDIYPVLELDGDTYDAVDNRETVSPTLEWQYMPSDDPMSWYDAKTYCANLGLNGHTDWRVPTILELRSIVRGCPQAKIGGGCNIEDGVCVANECRSKDCETPCKINKGPIYGCYWDFGLRGSCNGLGHWSSSIDLTGKEGAVILFDRGSIELYPMQLAEHAVRCVREN